MSVPELLAAESIASRQGGPFDTDDVAAACATVRGQCGWHVAPRVESDRLLVSGSGRVRLVLPSSAGPACPEPLILGIRDVVADQPVSGWRIGTAGMLIRDAGWPHGEDNLEVTLTHGYDECPADLASVVLERCRALKSPAPAGARSVIRTVGAVTTNTGYDPSAPAWTPAAAGVLTRYRV